MFTDLLLSESNKVLSVEERYRGRDRYNVGLFLKVNFIFFIVPKERWFGKSKYSTSFKNNTLFKTQVLTREKS